MSYTLDLIARRYGVAPWTINPDDPETYRYLRRALVFMNMEDDKAQAISKRQAKPRVRVGPNA